MTNAQIIFEESQRLAEEGVLEYTGREFSVENEDGTKETYKEVEPIHTYAMWKSMGYQVKKGEKAVTQISVWKYKQKKGEEGAEEGTGEGKEEGRMFKKLAYFFTIRQVEKAR